LFSRANAGSVASKPSPASRMTGRVSCTVISAGPPGYYWLCLFGFFLSGGGGDRGRWPPPPPREIGSVSGRGIIDLACSHREERSDHRRTPSWTQPANHPPLVSRPRLNIAGFPATSMLVFQHTFAGFPATCPQFLSLSLSYLFFLVLRE